MAEKKRKIRPNFSGEVQRLAVDISQQLAAMSNTGIMYHYGGSKDKTTENAVKNIRLMFQKNTIAFLDDLILENKPYFSNYEDLVKQYVK